MSRSVLQTAVGLLCAAVMAAALVSCGDDDGGGASSESDVPAGAVAVVGEQEITRSELDRRVAAARRAQRGRARQTRALREQQREQAMTLLLQEAALEQEAQEREVSVSDAEVRRRFAEAKRQFKSKRAFRRFLGGSSEADILFQLRLQLLLERVGEAARKDGDNPKSFAQEFRERWADRTACRDRYATTGCGNAPASGDG